MQPAPQDRKLNPPPYVTEYMVERVMFVHSSCEKGLYQYKDYPITEIAIIHFFNSLCGACFAIAVPQLVFPNSKLGSCFTRTIQFC